MCLDVHMMAFCNQQTGPEKLCSLVDTSSTSSLSEFQAAVVAVFQPHEAAPKPQCQSALAQLVGVAPLPVAA